MALQCKAAVVWLGFLAAVRWGRAQTCRASDDQAGNRGIRLVQTSRLVDQLAQKLVEDPKLHEVGTQLRPFGTSMNQAAPEAAKQPTADARQEKVGAELRAFGTSMNQKASEGVKQPKADARQVKAPIRGTGLAQTQRQVSKVAEQPSEDPEAAEAPRGTPEPETAGLARAAAGAGPDWAGFGHDGQLFFSLELLRRAAAGDAPATGTPAGGAEGKEPALDLRQKLRTWKAENTREVTLFSQAAAVIGTATAVGLSWANGAETRGKGGHRSMLLDNAKVCALFFVIYGHFLSYTLAGKFNGQNAWLAGAEGAMGNLRAAISPLKVPMLAFISGICSQGAPTPGRLRRFVIFLLVPTLLWMFFVKPVIFATLIDGSFGSAGGRLLQALELSAFEDEWYLQALVWWRASSLLVWSQLRPSTALAAMCALSCVGGYTNFGHGATTGLRLNETLGFLPYFAVGYVFPFERAVGCWGKPGPLVSVCALAALLAYTAVLLPYSLAGAVPSSHGPYGASGDAAAWVAAGTGFWAHAFYWTRRLAKVATDLAATLGLMFLVLPRGQTHLSWAGQHTLYPFLWHVLGLTWWDKLVASLGPRELQGAGAAFQGAVLLVNACVALLLLVCFSSWPWRVLWSWCFSLTWLQALVAGRSADAGEAFLSEGSSSGAADAGAAFLSERWSKPATAPETPISGSLSPAGVGFLSPRRGVLPAVVKGPPFPRHDVRCPPAASSSKDPSPRIDNNAPETNAYAQEQTSDQSTQPARRHERLKLAVRLPTMQESKGFSKFVLPLFLLGVALPPLYVLVVVTPSKVVDALLHIPLWLFVPGALFGFLARVVMTYGYQLWRLEKGTRPPAPLPKGTKPLLHVVMVVEYKEPIEVLIRTVDSIAQQTHIERRPVLVMACEARDAERHETCRILQGLCGDAVEEFIMTEHTLQPGESIGKHSNENAGAREVYRRFVEERGYSPFEVMLTVVDADSLLSSTYLAHVEASFRSMPDGRRFIYNGPLNTFRNLSDANFLVQSFEISRCHVDIFRSPALPYHPQSNYSFTLGMAQEIDFWMPDCISEDLKSHIKALANNFGSHTTVAIPAFICNDCVVGFRDRYVQAKRHQWGSVEEIPWQMKLAWDAPLDLRSWLVIIGDECSRQGSMFAVMASVVMTVLTPPLMYALVVRVAAEGDSGPGTTGKWILAIMVFLYLGSHIAQWVAELIMWRICLRSFPIMWPSRCRLAMIILLNPLTVRINDLIFCVGATVDCILHVTFRSTHLSYVCAPKGDQQ